MALGSDLHLALATVDRLAKLARSRGATLPQLSAKERTDPKAVQAWLNEFSNPPPDKLFRAAVHRAKELSIDLPNEAKVHYPSCIKFLRENPSNNEQRPVRDSPGISAHQEKTLQLLARLKRIKIPETARRSSADFEKFVNDSLEPGDLRRINHFVAETVMAPNDEDSLGFKVWALEHAMRFEDGPMEYIWRAIKLLLVNGSDPDEVADRYAAYEIDRYRVYQICVDLEEAGERVT